MFKAEIRVEFRIRPEPEGLEPRGEGNIKGGFRRGEVDGPKLVEVEAKT